MGWSIDAEWAYDHEGFVERELTIVNPLRPERGNWAGWWGSELDGKSTGRARAACDCGWRGYIVELDIDEGGMESVEDGEALRLVWRKNHIDSLTAPVRYAPPVPAGSGRSFDFAGYRVRLEARHGDPGVEPVVQFIVDALTEAVSR